MIYVRFFFWILDLGGIHRKWSQCQRFNAVRQSYHRKNSNFQLSSHSADKVYTPHSPFVRRIIRAICQRKVLEKDFLKSGRGF